MTEAILLSDNDVVHKFAVWDLLGELLEALNVAPEQTFLLPTAYFKLKKVCANYAPDVWERLDKFMSAVGVVDWELSAAEQLLFEDVHGIDQGEAVLFSATAAQADFIFATGDKVSLRALARTPSCKPILNRLHQRTVCLEQLVTLCVQRFGFECVKGKIVPKVGCDKAVSSAFGSGLQATERNVLDTLQSYVRHLESEIGIELAPFGKISQAPS